jgi:murein DD-endopeptidase MepM/ murein hydrolase activator NlpD
MPLGTGPDMLVVVDDHPSSSACLAIARRYANNPLTLAGWSADPTHLSGQLQSSGAATPTVSEAIRLASQNKVPWITMRRDIAAPEQLLGDLLVAAAHHRDADIAGFAVLLADGEPRPFERILAIVDRRGGPISGLLAYMGVVMTQRAGAQLDILVIGAEDEDLAADAGTDALLVINRERELYDRARELAREVGLSPTYITASTTEDPWAVVESVLASGSYDLVIDDLGAISLGRGRVKRNVEGALSTGEVGEVPLRLLNEVPVPLLLVIDEIRLGMMPAGLIKAGAVAAITLGVASTAVLPGAVPAAATQIGRPDDPTPLLDQLQGGIDTASPTQRVADAPASRSGGAGASYAVVNAAKPASTKKAKKITVPKGGADPADVQRARRAAAKAKTQLRAAQKVKKQAATSLTKAEAGLVKAEQRAEESRENIIAAQAEDVATQAVAERAASESSGVLSLLPGGATDLEAAVAQAEADRAHTDYLTAVAEGGDALTALTAAQLRLEDRQFELARASETARQAKAGYTADQARFEVYKKSLAATRQTPVARGHYRLTAHFGQAGGYWSSGIHTGLDFAGKVGTYITAAASGTVVSTGYEGAYGNRVVVDHGNGYQTTYNHLSAISVSVGDKVTTGDLIGKLGGTGNVTGPHLHFEVTHNDKFVDPEAWLGW